MLRAETLRNERPRPGGAGMQTAIAGDTSAEAIAQRWCGRDADAGSATWDRDVSLLCPLYQHPFVLFFGKAVLKR